MPAAPSHELSAPSPTPLVTAAAEVAVSVSMSATESVKRRGMQLSSELKEFVSGFAAADSPDMSIPLEWKLISALLVLFLFLLFLILVLWDRYGKEIGELYTPNVSASARDANDVSPNDVADEYTVYQKLPTFFYEYAPRKKRN
ncbi:hypothetical protein Poli38472_002394 [Pythium oligandrum]|uniref:Uncharacterized protein n=1 Tax=Pythium oligandrum TaxID=41045 RepID=A0A8K1CI89_PYTOL|nr:hypothetical protein Poli38472_002394 [Pythium oligandrum]|eukprot:TMW63453.1 hypothetical protein Poli38472_002394 [Pythium oligandrum]